MNANNKIDEIDDFINEELDELLKNTDSGVVGVIIGRFQVHELHPGHIELIDAIIKKHSKVVIFLGNSLPLVTKKNPLDFSTRRLMIQKKYPKINVLPIRDMRSDEDWSKVLDDKIREIHPREEIILYGSRDSFIPHYKGKFKTHELEQTLYTSGTEVRKHISETVKSSPDFRAGVIYAAYNQYPSIHPTVDVFIYKNREFLLAKKPNETKFRLVGGFVDINDSNFETAAKREVSEETKIEIDDLQYITSIKVNDWRYRSEEGKIFTTLYSAKYIFGRPEPSDDISELCWFHSDTFKLDDVVEEHKELVKLAIKKVFDIDLEHKKDPTC